MTNCDKKYTYIQSENFGNRRKVTSKLLQTYAENDTWLKEEIEKLWDSTDPENRHVFHPPLVDPNLSYGVIPNGSDAYSFSNNTQWTGSTDFKNYLSIDTIKTDAYINLESGVATLRPVQDEDVSSVEFQGPWPTGISGCNEHWYISYNRSKTYEAKDDWIKNQDNVEIPCTSRAQTFNTGDVEGYLETLNLNLIGTSKAEYPLIIEVRDATMKSVLARAEWKPETTSFGGIVSIIFKDPAKLEKNTTYSFTLRSPLTSYNNHYSIGGWSKPCFDTTKKDTTGTIITPYTKGQAYLSENNFASTISFGKSEKLDYHEGQNAPVDFAFQCIIRPSIHYTANTTEYVYFKPQEMNPIIDTYLVDPVYSEFASTNVTFEVSSTGKENSWKTLNKDNAGAIQWESKYGITPTRIFLRIGLQTTNTTITPMVDYLRLLCHTKPALEGRIRTYPWCPEKRDILGASCWSRIDAPYYFDPGTFDATGNSVAPQIDGEDAVDIKIDIVRDKVNIERFKIIDISDLSSYFTNPELITAFLNKVYGKSFDYSNPEDAKTITDYINTLISELKEITADETTIYDTSKIQEWVGGTSNSKDINGDYTKTEGKDFIEYLKSLSIYLTADSSTFKFNQSPAYPIINVSYQSNTENSSIENLTEFVNYHIDYDKDTITFINEDNTTRNISAGTITLEYNPLFVKGLNTYSLPLALDLFIENFTIGDTTNSKLTVNDSGDSVYSLAVEPLNAIRKIVVNPETNNEIELIENLDYNVDYQNRLVTLHPVRTINRTVQKVSETEDNTECPYKVIVESNTTVLNSDDNVEIHYTPYLPDNGLSIVYRLKRYSKDYDVIIQPNYLQYRI